ncbi:methylmalonyl-CoA mutase [Prauserella marina]|uniref:Methylmalonyl-CoA mutase n=1 Tax=Prauserella marina TaxID=530584 RepID=A0A222VJX8_9PSEU|nr:methylmalonyl-CoA mutase family protein [Prauserella marina]ASR34228.1 methylmalonyl-CoA mutase [Prauserella marina]PWV72008.1 heterodimeric methylmalonyl-CoA mutase small subunit [Prauserella marina]SDD93135.1 methylmalonyl-CoA mutase [Prauserella marina]
MTDVAGTPGSEPDQLTLAGEFEPASRAEWERLVAGVLTKSGALPADFTGAPDQLLGTRTYDGITIQPLYTAEDAEAAALAGYPGLPPFVRGTAPDGHVAGGWDIRALHGEPDPAATNRAVLADLEGGVNSVWLRVGDGALAPDALAEALTGVHVDLAPVVLEPGDSYLAGAEAFFALLAERNIPASAVTGNLGADPVGVAARTGTRAELAPAAELAAEVVGRYPGLRTIVADALPFHEAGGSDAQELGAAIAAGVAYLRALTGAGLDVATAADQIEFRFAATADQFLTIAKLRAARRLWSRVTEVSGARGAGMRQHAVTSPAMLTRRDPWVNMLRTTIAAFAAGTGGADSVTVLPFDAAIGLSDAFARRIARNTQAILLEESKLAGVIDPAGGSWYVEKLTDDMAKAAWREFTGIEKGGGLPEQLRSGELADRLAETLAARRKRLDTRADPITGVSEYPDLNEKPVTRPTAPSVVDGGGLRKVRYAEDYEALRDRSDKHLAEHGARPSVFLATLGPLAAHTARAMFAANLFQAGGIEPVNPGVTSGTDELVAAFTASGTSVACLCGSDKSYAEQASEVAAALRAAGATEVLLAGAPSAYEGVSGYVHSGCPALTVLTGLLDTLAVD